MTTYGLFLTGLLLTAFVVIVYKLIRAVNWRCLFGRHDYVYSGRSVVTGIIRRCKRCDEVKPKEEK